jgi:hypothetical protein
MITLKPPRRDVTNTQWQQFTSQFNKLVSDQAAFRTSVTAKLNDLEAKVDSVVANTTPTDPPA